MSGNTVIGIQKDAGEGFAPRWAQAVEARGATVKWLDLLGPEPLKQVAGCAGVMWHWYHYPSEIRWAALPILRTLEEHLHLSVFPDQATCWHFDDKIAQAHLLEALDIPHPKTWIFWRKAEALAWCAGAGYPVVAKLAGGAGSQNVRLVRSAAEARDYVGSCFSGSGIVVRPGLPPGAWARPWARLKRAAKRAAQAAPYVLANRFPALPDQTHWMPHKNYALFQEFLPDNEFDTRVTVIGARAFAFRRLNRPGDFRASGSGRLDPDPRAVDLRCVEAAFAAARKLGAQSMAFDFLFQGRGGAPVVGEISYAYADWAVEQCPGHWDAGLQWHAGRLWPEEAHVEDFLARIRRGAAAAP